MIDNKPNIDMKYLIFFLIMTTPVFGQNNIIDHTEGEHTEFVKSALDKLDIENVTLLIRPLNTKKTDSYGRKILAIAFYSKEYPDTYVISISPSAKRLLVAHELIHIWQAYNGRPCEKTVSSCEIEADRKKAMVF